MITISCQDDFTILNGEATMTAYLVIHVEITDPEQYQEYARLSPAIVQQYGGRYIVRNGEKVTLEGPEETRRMVIVEFPSLEQAQKFYHSPEYQQARAVREGAATGHFVAIEGVE
jgi:uncharacterized protein (DUF1330 family)